jgi:hypothetical protein
MWRKREETMDASKSYEIRIEGHLGASWAPWFEGMEIRHEKDGETVLVGVLADQAALHGVLMRIRDLGLPLVAVSRIAQIEDEETGDQSKEEGMECVR